MFFKIALLKNLGNFTGRHLCRSLFDKAAGLKNCEICEIFKKFFYRKSQIAASESFRFPAYNFIKRETSENNFFCEYSKIF